MKKNLKIVLKSKEGAKRPFSLPEAETLLNYEAAKNKNNWSIADKSKYIFENGNIKPRKDTGTSDEAPEPTENK